MLRAEVRGEYTSRMNLPPWPYPKTIAHRGAGKLAPENTLAAIRHGVSLGYRAAEIDVKLSGDGTLLLMHDDTTNRCSDGRGRVAAKTWHQLALLDAGSWHSKAFAGEPIPTYWRVANYCIANGVQLNTEIKPCIGRERETGAAVALETRALFCEPAHAALMPLLSSFSTDALLAARDAAPEFARAHLFDNPLPTDWLARCKAVGAIAMDAHWRTLTEEIVAAAHASGLRVACYTCNELADAERLWAWGVDSVITDAVDRIAFRD